MCSFGSATEAEKLQKRAAVNDPGLDRWIGERGRQAFDGHLPIEVNLHRHGAVPGQAIPKGTVEDLDRLESVGKDAVNEVLLGIHTLCRYAPVAPPNGSALSCEARRLRGSTEAPGLQCERLPKVDRNALWLVSCSAMLGGAPGCRVAPSRTLESTIV